MMKVGAAGSTGNTINKKDLSYAGSSLALNFVKDYKKVSRYTDPTKIPGYTFTRSSGGYAETVSGTSMFFPELRTNLNLQSQTLDVSPWGSTNATVIANAISAPDGTLTADFLKENTANGVHNLYQFTPTISTLYVISIYAKAGIRSKLGFAGGGVLSQGLVPVFDLSNGTMYINTGNSGTITNVGNGWYRCCVTFAPSNTGALAWTMNDAFGSSTYTGDGTSGLYLWGAQVETITNPACTYPMDYIPTTTAAVSVSGGYGIANGGLMWFTGTRTNLINVNSTKKEAWSWLVSTTPTSIDSAGIAPDGTNTAWMIPSNAGTTFNQANYTIPVDTLKYCESVYVKALDPTATILFTANGPNALYTSTFTFSTLSFSGNVQNATVAYVGNGWYRLSQTFTNSSSNVFVLRIDGGANTNGKVLFWGTQLEPANDTRITYPTAYIPTTTAAVSIDTPRITNKGYLSEEARTNLVLYSQQLDTGWVPSGSGTFPTITANQTTAPDGTLTADLFTRATTVSSYLAQGVTKAASSLTYTLTVYAKKSVGDYCSMRLAGSFPAMANVAFNLATGVISLAAVTSSTFTNASATITPSSNGFYKLTLTATTDAITSIGSYFSFASTNIQIDGVDTASNSAGYLWGAQLEAGAYATSYIPTTTVAATRASDVMLYTGISVPSAYSIYTQFNRKNDIITSFNGAFSLNDGSTTNEVYGTKYSSTTALGYAASAGVAKEIINGTTSATALKMGIRVANNNGGGVVNGTQANGSSVSSIIVPANTTNLEVGRRSGNNLNDYVQNITVYTAALTDAKLQEITTPAIPEASFNASFADGTFSTSADGISSTYYSTASAMPGYTFTRASGGYAETVAGNLVYFNSGVPRITDKGYLSEEARTNLVFPSTNWSNQAGIGFTATNNYAVAPDGTTTGMRLQWASQPSSFRYINNITSIAATPYTTTLYIKANTVSQITLYLGASDASTGVLANFNTNTLSLTNIINNGSGGNVITGVTSSVTASVNGWYRISITATSSQSLTNMTTGVTVSVDIAGDVNVWGLQLEQAAFATSYIPTTTAAATRAADVMNYTISGYNAAAGTIVSNADVAANAANNANKVISSIYLASSPSGGMALTTYQNLLLLDKFNTGGILILASPYYGTGKSAIRYNSSNIVASYNGGAITTSANTYPAAADTLAIGKAVTSGYLNGYVKSITTYSAVLTDAQLQAITR